MTFTYEIPSEFENEERWLSIFTLKSLLSCLVAFGIGILISKITTLLFFSAIPGILISIVLTLGAYIVTTFKIPEEYYLKGGGLPIFIYLINRIYRKHSSVLYVLGYGNEKKGA